jgi:hypothetical protein
VARLKEEFNADVEVLALFDNPTVQGISSLVNTGDSSTGPGHREKLRNDEEKSIMVQDITILDDLVVPLRKSGWNSTNEIHRVLLTGATGFVGAYLLFSLLEMTEAEIVCLVRSDGESEAAGRIEENLRRYSIWSRLSPAQHNRIVAIADTPVNRSNGLPLGMSSRARSNLTCSLDCIFHCAAWVHALYPYRRLREANVIDTAALIRLCTEAHTASPAGCQFNHVSTLSIFPGRPGRVMGRWGYIFLQYFTFVLIPFHVLSPFSVFFFRDDDCPSI